MKLYGVRVNEKYNAEQKRDMRSIIKNLSQTAWFVDYDGTLCPHQEVWEERVYDSQEISAAVKNLQKKVQGFFWNTGRRPESLASVNEEFKKFHGFFIQGTVFWSAEEQKDHLIGVEFPQHLSESLQNQMEFESQYRLEIKPTGARVACLRKTQRKNIKKFAESLQLDLSAGWEWRVGDRGAELLHIDYSKGTALHYAYEKKMIPEAAVPVAIGDDYFDRAAMEYALERGGYAILIGEGCGWITEVPHKSSQVVFFREPKDFLQFIKAL
jgi:hydroxymethylpyrimidine pyrophosphatase-like HAD family hydrolase